MSFAAPVAPPAALQFIDDDLDSARARARAEHKLLFVDAWAPWCHTCLSMRNYVFPDPSLRPLAQRVVFAAIDTDKPSSAPFLERFPVTAWPSLFILDPANDHILAYWPGSASAADLRALIDDAQRLADASAPPGDPLRDLADARAALASGNLALAQTRFASLLDRADASWPRRADALMGMMETLRALKDYRACAELGRRHLDDISGASKPGDFAWLTLDCASSLPAGDARSTAEQAAIRRLRAFADCPSADASIDDRADVLGTLADALEQAGDHAGAAKMHDRRIAMLEDAAAHAPTPAMASTFDYLLANSYVARGRGENAIRMLQAREREFPESYEPPARLADVLVALGRYDEALAAVDRAISHAYGPRKLRYLATKAAILGKLGRHADQVQTLQQEVSGWAALGRGQANESRRADAQQRLENARNPPAAHTSVR